MDTMPTPIRRAVAARGAIEIRSAGDGDARALRRLASLSGELLPEGPFVLAEVDGEPLAALSLSTGASLADPFRATYDLVALLRLRAEHLRAAA
jgi:hypothetical protein